MRSVLQTHGTINCIALDGSGRLAGVTTTSGLSWKLAGRVGDSPIIGAGPLCRQRDRRGRLHGPGGSQPPDLRQLPDRRRHGPGPEPRTGLPRSLQGGGGQDQARAPPLRRPGPPEVRARFLRPQQEGRIRRGRSLPGGHVRGPRRGREQAPRSGLSLQEPGGRPLGLIPGR
ncbi:MAG: isoaspartyl peptidase/L-asparaginase [Desulfobacterales bacterium]|nr:isoaspartyl peptidase/L-asparaginase [Desulfobacterales bacterium]